MEGTLFEEPADNDDLNADTVWAAIAEELGPDAVAGERELLDRWEAGEFDGYVEFVEATIRLHQSNGLTRDRFHDIVDSVAYREGVGEVLAALDDRDIPTAVLTGGFKAMAERVQRDHRVNHAFAACEYYWGPDGEIEYWNVLPSDHRGKIDFMQIIAEEHGADPADCAFVGNGSNDVPLAREVGTAIAIDGPDDLVAVSDHNLAVHGEDSFADIKDILLAE